MLNKLLKQEVEHYITIKIKRNKRAKGLIISFKIQGKDGKNYVFCGHSLCDNKDQYSKETAYLIALSRAVKKFDSDSYGEVPQSIQKEFNKMQRRMSSYYKDVIYPKWFVPTVHKD
jgi:hypothetical protein